MLRRLLDEIRRVLRYDFGSALFLFKNRLSQAVSDLPWHIRARVITLLGYNYQTPDELERALAEIERLLSEYEKSK